MRDKKGELSRSLPLGAKESCRWVEGYERLAEQAASLPDTRMVYVTDREGDFIKLMAKADALGTPVDWLIRSIHNRTVVEEQDKLWDGFGAEHVLGEIHFTLPARKKQPAREVLQQISVKRCAIWAGKGKSIGNGIGSAGNQCARRRNAHQMAAAH